MAASGCRGFGLSSTRRKKGKEGIDLEEALKRMTLKNSELNDVFAGEETSELSKAGRWLVVAWVDTKETI